MSRKVSFTRDELPPLTAEEEARLAALVARPDDEVDTSEIPELTEEQMAHGVRGRFTARSNSRSRRGWTPTCSLG